VVNIPIPARPRLGKRQPRRPDDGPVVPGGAFADAGPIHPDTIPFGPSLPPSVGPAALDPVGPSSSLDEPEVMDEHPETFDGEIVAPRAESAPASVPPARVDRGTDDAPRETPVSPGGSSSPGAPTSPRPPRRDRRKQVRRLTKQVRTLNQRVAALEALLTRIPATGAPQQQAPTDAREPKG